MKIAHLKLNIKTEVDQIFSKTQDLYEHLHEHPELSFDEFNTSERLAKELKNIGYKVTTKIGKTGIVAILENGEGPTVMLRADMDALPIKEKTGLDYASHKVCHKNGGNTPIMHACGHDLHSSSLVGAAEVLYNLKDSWSGKLMLICQPAEEIFGGSKAMLKDGLYERFGRPDIILGQHNMPALAGTIGLRSGVSMAACSNISVTIHGAGGHGSMPENTVDPVIIAAHVVTRLQTIVSREVPSYETVVVTVGKLQAGTQANIIPHHAELEINVRSFNDDIHKQVVDAIYRIINAECEASRSPKPPEIEIMNETISLNNDETLFNEVRQVYAEYFGEDNLYEMPKLSGSEDFPYLGNAKEGGFEGPDIPSLYWLIGSTPKERWEATEGETVTEKMRNLEMPHSPHYFPGNPVTLRTGIEALVVGALTYLKDDTNAD
ncbi:amidohydrolase [Psychrobacter lutiphocae]|uniref:amidohydrolase n=1 Tax=Psychrobacter lutiphocae TaxID=540500 RepID=UPI00037716F5|nr:amidohydrolase [Psychrobacter lutiphocae]